MATLTIRDLCTERKLDGKTMSRIRGAGGAGWVYGWIRPFIESTPGFGGGVNFYQTNNFFVADQMNNQVQVIGVTNSGDNASINISPKQQAANLLMS
jgi:hypothetical protein